MAGNMDFTVDLRSFDRFVKQWDAASLRAMKNALQIEGYRLKKVVEAELRAGVGEGTAQLTQKEQRTKSPAALSAMARIVGYVVDRDDFSLKIGFARTISRAKNPSGKRKQFLALLEGGAHTVTREYQRSMAYKIRKRLGEPVINIRGQKYSNRWHANRQRLAAGRRKWADIGAFLPAIGASLSWPHRDVMAQVVARERNATLRNVASNFRMKMAGLRVVSQ